MRAAGTEFTTDLVDLSGYRLLEVLRRSDPEILVSMDTLVRDVRRQATWQTEGSGSPSFAAADNHHP